MTYRPLKSAARWLEGAPSMVLACYDNGGRSFDRYTILYGAPWWTPEMGRNVPYFAASERPFHPQGFGQHGEMPTYNRAALGKKIKFSDLPDDVQRAVIQDSRCD